MIKKLRDKYYLFIPPEWFQATTPKDIYYKLREKNKNNE